MKQPIKYLFVSIFLIGMTDLSLANELNFFVADTLPALKTTFQTRTDTVKVYDPDLKKSEVKIVNTVTEYVEVIDTILVFDYERYEETMRITKNKITIQDYYTAHGHKRFEWIDKYVEALDSNNAEKDTFQIFDSKSFEETTSVIMRCSDCYLLSWDSRMINHKLNISSEEFMKMLSQKAKIIKMGQKEHVKDFSFRYIIVPSRGPISVGYISDENPFMSEAYFKHFALTKGGRVYIENIMAQGQKVIEALVIHIE